jgi:phosphoenolpyruvate---glycerone phosphotransferase subunit DhaL
MLPSARPRWFGEAKMTSRETLDRDFALAWIDQFATLFSGLREHLGYLDRLAGDGDFGTNLNSALGRARANIAEDAPGDFADVFTSVSRGFLNTGGTSGPLFGMWFRELAKASAVANVTVEALAIGISLGLSTVQRMGNARVGDNTMVDAMSPAADALTDSVANNLDLATALQIAASAARAGAESTRSLVASRGRASYVGEVARGVLDPGAVAVALFFQAAVCALAASTTESDVTWVTAEVHQ